MLGVGRNLQTPCLQPDVAKWIKDFTIVCAERYLVKTPVENIQDINQCLITDVLPVSPFMDYPQKWLQIYGVILKFTLSAIWLPNQFDLQGSSSLVIR